MVQKQDYVGFYLTRVEYEHLETKLTENSIKLDEFQSKFISLIDKEFNSHLADFENMTNCIFDN